MFGDDRKWYGLRSKTKAGTQYEPARLQKDPPYTSSASSYAGAQYAVPRYSTIDTNSGYSTTYSGPENSKPYTSTTSLSSYAAPVNPTPYVGNGYSSSYTTTANPELYTSSKHPSSYASSTNTAPYNGSGYSEPPQYHAPAKLSPYVASGYSGQSSGPVPPLQHARLGYSAQNDSFGKIADQLLDDLTGKLSETRIGQQPSAQNYQTTHISALPHQDAIDEVVQNVLTRDLRMLDNEKLLPTDPVFDLARQFALKWDISDEAVNSHIMLACGYFKFPVILLLNPAPTHEFKPFDEMVNECKTLRWIEDVLYGIGLGLKDVIILDACTMLGNNRIKQLEREGKGVKKQAMAEAYDLTQKMLRRIQPNIILSCQCSTNFPDWSVGGHPVARQLCSSIRSAKNREVKKVYFNERTINVIQAYHPSGFLNNKGDRKAHHDTFGNLLKGVFRTVYIPCANWKSQHLMVLLASSNTSRYRSLGKQSVY